MNFDIINLDRNLPDGIITKAHWSVSQTVDGVTVYEYGSTLLIAKDVSDPSFIPFTQVTKEQVKTWVMEALGEIYINELQNILNSKIEAQKTPKSSDGLPWSDSE